MAFSRMVYKLIPLVVVALISKSLAQSDPMATIRAAMSDPSFVAYEKPNQRVEEWIALGDSYTAGTGCNGKNEIVGDDAVRGKRAYPMQMSTEVGWEYINNDNSIPRFSFSAYTGDTTVNLVSEQLVRGDYSENNENLPRHPFGKPQLATMTIGGNDAGLSSILDACIFLALRSDCAGALATLTKALDDGSLQDKISVGLFDAAIFGREQEGAVPRSNFQLYVTGYTIFFNQDNPECDDISWGFWPFWKPKLTRALRTQLNGLTLRVNGVIKAAAEDLERVGVIYVDGLESIYNGHRFCEPGHTNNDMVDYDTWYWSPNAHTDTTSEGPGDPDQPYSTSDPAPDMQQILADFLWPDKNIIATQMTADQAPDKDPIVMANYPTFDSLLRAMEASANASVLPLPFNYRRCFHPKGSVYTHHKELFMAAIADNRDTPVVRSAQSSSDLAALPQPSPTGTSSVPSQPAMTTLAPVSSPTDSCDVSYKFLFDQFEIRGKNFDLAQFGDNGSGLKHQLAGCGDLTDWHFEWTPNDPSFAWYAHGRLPIGTKSCVGRAVMSAGGANAGNCHGSG